MYISVNYRRMPITFYISGKHFVGLVIIINKRAKFVGVFCTRMVEFYKFSRIWYTEINGIKIC